MKRNTHTQLTVHRPPWPHTPGPRNRCAQRVWRLALVALSTLLLVSTSALAQDARALEEAKAREKVEAEAAEADAAAIAAKEAAVKAAALDQDADDADQAQAVAEAQAVKAKAAEAKAREAAKEAAKFKALRDEAAAEIVADEVAPTPQATPPANPQLSYERTLLANHVEPTVAGMREYLVSLHPGPETVQQLHDFVNKLGHESFAVREQAMQDLRKRSAIAMDILAQAGENKDPEIRWRAKTLLQNASQNSDSVFFAIFKMIEVRQLKGLAGPILKTLPLCGQAHVRFAGRKAVAVTATPVDAPLLKQHLTSADPLVRTAVLGALEALDPKAAVADALQLSTDTDEGVRLAAARLLASQGERKSLALLIALLDAKEISVRGEAGRTLKALTGEDFKFVAYDAAEVREAARARWQEWLVAQGENATLKLPLDDTTRELGRIIVCSYAHNKVYEFDVDAKDPSKPNWEIQAPNQPWDAQGLPSGNRLLALYGTRQLLEYGPENNATKPIWQSETLPGGPMGVQRLENGRTLVACTDAGLVVELDTDGKLVKDRQWKVDGRPVHVQRLENGHTLVTLQQGHRVIEIDDQGQEKWTTKVALQNPFSAQRLANGNTLIASLSGFVVEVGADGTREEWKLTGLANPYHAERLSNGNILVADRNGVNEYDAQTKKSVWSLSIPHVSRAHRF